jgi:hypothetical protein
MDDRINVASCKPTAFHLVDGLMTSAATMVHEKNSTDQVLLQKTLQIRHIHLVAAVVDH